jgi:autotransporter translocation and assembly factor TamB
MLHRLTRAIVYTVVLVLILIGLGIGTLQTAWGRNQLRRLVIRQANQYLTASLEIERLDGSLFSSIELSGVRLSLEGRTLVSIESVSATYSLRELFASGTTIKRVHVVQPRVVARRQPDGRWDLAAIVKREARAGRLTGPGRPIHILSIEVTNGSIELRDPVAFGAVHLPARFDALNTSLSFDYQPVAWRLLFARMSWTGGAPDLTVTQLTGGIASDAGGVSFSDVFVQTPRSAFTLSGRIVREPQPTVLALQVKAERFAFQEWAGIISGLKNIAVEGAFDARLNGPLTRLATDLSLRSNGGNVRGPFVLDTSVPGWHGTGSVRLERLDLARWLNRPDLPSNISGRVDFNLALELGHVPHGSYAFDGPHAGYFGYEADSVRLKGAVTSREVRIDEGTARAYGASVRVSAGSISIDEPYHFRFQGTVNGLDLRRVPPSVPVPHVQSALGIDYDVDGQFAAAFVRGRARFAASEFLGVTIGEGTIGTLDTSTRPIHYGGEGDVRHLDLHRLGAGLDVAWMQEPRYAGTADGHFRVEGAGGDPRSMTLSGGGRLARADFFDGMLSDADVDVHIADGSLQASYDGRLLHVNPAVALGDPRFAAALSGSARARFGVTDLLLRTPGLDDYDIDLEASLEGSGARGVQIDRGEVTARLSEGSLNVTVAHLTGPALEAQGSGVIELDGRRSSRFDYDILRADLSRLNELLGRSVAGGLVTKGQLTGPSDALRLSGDGTVDRAEMSGIIASATAASYDLTIPPDGPARMTARVQGRASSVEAFSQPLQLVEGAISYADGHLDVDLAITRDDLKGSVKGTVLVRPGRRSVDLTSLLLTVQDSAWRLSAATPPPSVTWDNGGIAVSSMTFVDAANADQRIRLSGTWRADGSGALRLTATRVFLDTLTRERPAQWGGVVDLDATLRGTRDRPIVDTELSVTDGRFRQFSYKALSGHVAYADGLMQVNLRLDQAPGVWLTADGSVPVGLFIRDRPEQPMNVAIASSSIGLNLVEGLTTIVRNVGGEMRVNLTAVGTSRDPHFTGTIELTNAGFVIAASGSRYRNGRASLLLASDRVTVGALHLEDNRGRSLDVRGSLGTHELRVGDVEIDVSAKGFEVLRNEFGNLEVDARLTLRGKVESPRIEGSITVASGELKVDEILDRSLFRPYATEAASGSNVDTVAALNPWDRLGLGIEVHVPGNLRMTGNDVQVTAGTPIGLGSFNIRAIGDLYLYKDPAQQLYVTGSLDSVTGTYAFQGRRFDIDPTSSINFHGDLNPDLYVTVGRVISGVDARVTISGPLSAPELRLSSTPPLEPSDIMALIVFNQSTSELSSLQQQELAIRTGTLAAGFLVTPLVTALERTLGLELLEIEPPAGSSSGPRVTVGDELAPGLIARFSRQFGPGDYDEATIEYYLSRILRIRATFSDATALTAGALFHRVERAGIDLIVFFSF